MNNHTTYSTLHAGDINSTINSPIHVPISVPVQMFDSLNLVMLLSMEHRGGRIVRRCRLLYDVYLDEGDRIMYNPFSRGTGRGTASIGGRSLWRI